MTGSQLKIQFLTTLSAIALLAGCSGGSSGGESGTGVLNLSVSDAPVQGVRTGMHRI